MEFLLKIYRWLNLISIDVSAGTVVCAAFFGELLGVTINISVFIALSLTVWIIYTADHLLDSRKLKTSASTFRHRFFQLHHTIFIVLLVIAVLADSIIVINFPRPLSMAGSYLILPIIIYLLLQRFISPFKELCGAIFYTAGVMLPALVLRTIPMSSFLVIAAIQFFLVAWMNLLLFSLFDKERDERDYQVSFATKYGEIKTHRFIFMIFLGILGLTLYQVFYQHWFTGLIMLAMSLVLLLMVFKKDWFMLNERFRLTGDAIFFLPLLYFLISR